MYICLCVYEVCIGTRCSTRCGRLGQLQILCTLASVWLCGIAVQYPTGQLYSLYCISRQFTLSIELMCYNWPMPLSVPDLPDHFTGPLYHATVPDHCSWNLHRKLESEDSTGPTRPLYHATIPDHCTRKSELEKCTRISELENCTRHARSLQSPSRARAAIPGGTDSRCQDSQR